MRSYKLSIVQKICLSGILIVLIAIFQKIFAINYLPFAPFVRLSFGGAALVIFSSVLLGPWFGMLIGGASDLFGYLIFDPKAIAPMFQITFIYMLLGFISYYAFKWISKIKKEKLTLIIEGATFLLIAVVASLVVNLTSSITLYGNTYNFDLTAKICVPVISFILLGLLFVAVIFINKHFKKKGWNISVYNVSFACFALEIVVMLLFGSAMKVWGFNMFYSATPFAYIFFSQLIVSLFNIPFNTVAISYIMVLSDKVIKQY